jgi:hypothetical protein
MYRLKVQRREEKDSRYIYKRVGCLVFTISPAYS